MAETGIHRIRLVKRFSDDPSLSDDPPLSAAAVAQVIERRSEFGRGCQSVQRDFLTRDRCYDFLNIISENSLKFSEKLALLTRKQS
jgi:hypothetical protein